jgi:hypothetical protein
MEFQIDGFNFTATIEQGQLVGLTAEKDDVTYNCMIQLVSQTAPETRQCCYPDGHCYPGGC